MLRKIAMDDKIKLSDVRAVWETQGMFVRKVMEKGAFEKVRMPFIGAFMPSVKKLQSINQRYGIVKARRKREGRDTSGSADDKLNQ